MFTRDLLLELAKHLKLTDVAKLACVNREINQLTQDEIFWQYLYRSSAFKGLDIYQTYRDKCTSGWKLLHPLKYSMLTIHTEDYNAPLGIFNTTDMDLIVDKIIELYYSELNSEFNMNINRAIKGKYEITKEQLLSKINKPNCEYLALEPIAIYDYPTDESTLNCLYYSEEDFLEVYGCFQSTKRNHIIDMIVFLINNSDEFSKDNAFSPDSDYDDDYDNDDPDDDDYEEAKFKKRYCEKYKNKSITTQDVEYMLDDNGYDEGVFILKEIPVYKVTVN